MKPIETLSRLLRFFGWLSIAIGFLFLIPAILSQTVSLLLGLSNAQRFLSGIVFLSLAQGLSKKEKWAFYIGFIIFSLFLLQSIVKTFFAEFSFVLVISFGIQIFFLFLLIKGKQQFIGQPKEKIFQWFRKPHFIVVVAGTLILYIISVVAFSLLEGVTIFQVL